MKKLALGLVAVLVVLILGVVGLAMTKSDTVVVERSTTIDATAADVAPFAHDLRKVVLWSPWVDKDPDLTQTFSDPSTGVDAWYAWEGDENVGSGKQTVTVSEPGKVTHHLEFFTPFEGEADATLTWTQNGDSVDVTWGYTQDSTSLGGKVMQVFLDMDDMIGPDFAAGLAKLKPLAEAAAGERVAAEEAAAAEEAKRLAEAAAAQEQGEEEAAE